MFVCFLIQSNTQYTNLLCLNSYNHTFRPFLRQWHAFPDRKTARPTNWYGLNNYETSSRTRTVYAAQTLQTQFRAFASCPSSLNWGVRKYVSRVTRPIIIYSSTRYYSTTTTTTTTTAAARTLEWRYRLLLLHHPIHKRIDRHEAAGPCVTD